MQVSSLELSKELYELSGWGEELDYGWAYQVNRSELVHLAGGDGIGENFDFAPAYTAGYLLRALPADLPNPEWGGFDQPKKVPLELAHVMAGAGEWWAQYHVRYNVPIACVYADTAEDALCKLAIELFKAGVLEKKS